MANRHDDFRQVGVQVMAVSMSAPDGVGRYVKSHPLPLPVLADPDRKLYAALRLGRTSWARLARPGFVWKYLKLIARGGKLRPVAKGEDPLQLGGDFLIDRNRTIVWAYRSTDPADRPGVEELLRVARTSVDDGTGAP